MTERERSGPKPRNAHRADLERSGADTAQRLLLAAARLFWQKGFEATTTRDLSADVGIQNASLYYHIQSKEHLLYELSIASLRDIEAQARAVLDGGDDPLSTLRAFIRAHVASMSDEREMHATMLTELRSLKPKHRADVVSRRDGYERLLQSVLKDCQKMGAIRTDIPTRLLGRCLLNLLNWSIFWFDPRGKLSAGELAGVIESIFLEGALTVPRNPGQRVLKSPRAGVRSSQPGNGAKPRP